MKVEHKHILLIASLVLANGFLNCSPLNLLLSVPQFLYVAYLIYRGDYEKAALLHILFIVTSFSYNITDRAMDELGASSLTSYNYAKFKIASIPLFFINNVFFIYELRKKKKKISNNAKKSDFYIYYKFLKYTFIIGFIIGVPGLLFFEYFREGFLNYGSYALFMLSLSYIFLLMYDTKLKDLLYSRFPTLLMVSIIVMLAIRIFGIKLIGTVYVTYFAAMLLPYSLYNKSAIIPLVIMLAYMADGVITGTGGKVIVQFALVAIVVFFLAHSSRLPVPRKKVKRFRYVYYFLLVAVPIAGVYLIASLTGDEESNFSYKLHNVQSLLSFFVGAGGLHDIDRSPYIRVAEIANVLYEDLTNPLYLIFGRGFGGFYRDNLGLFNYVDISFDCFSDEQLVAKRYYTGHDAFVSIPMVNGLFGVYWWIRTMYAYVKNMYRNYLKVVVIPFLLLIYYFDSQIGMIGTLLLFASESQIAFAKNENTCNRLS